MANTFKGRLGTFRSITSTSWRRPNCFKENYGLFMHSQLWHNSLLSLSQVWWKTRVHSKLFIFHFIFETISTTSFSGWFAQSVKVNSKLEHDKKASLKVKIAIFHAFVVVTYLKVSVATTKVDIDILLSL